MIKLGTKVKDSLTGLEGTAIARIEYLNGCVSIEIRPEGLHEGRPIKTVWVDEQQLDKTSKATSGGPGSTPSPAHIPD